MTPDRPGIFIVEDQRLIAADLENTLRKLGYDVVGKAASGEEACAAVPPARPDLVLMDVRLHGRIDGIAAAEAIGREIDVPVVYVTAYADEETIRRAKVTGPFGYVVKPFNPRELKAAIEIALYKHATDRVLAEERARRREAEEFRFVVESVEEYAIFRLDPEGRVASWNVGAERIKGYRAEEILGRHVSVFYTPDDVARGEPERLLEVARREGRTRSEGWRLRKDGGRYWANCLLTAVREPDGRLLGYAKVVRDSTERKRREEGQVFLDRATVVLASSLEVSETIQRGARLAVPHLGDWCALELADERGELRPAAVAHAEPEREGLVRELVRAFPAGRGPGGPVFRSDAAARHEFESDSAAARFLGVEGNAPLSALGAASYLGVPIRYRGRCQGVLNLVRAGPAERHRSRDVGLAEEFARRVGLAIDNATHFHEAREAIRARDEFLQIASHELKTPLTPLQIQLDAFRMALDRAGVGDPRLLGKLDTATRQTVRLTRLVESLLDVTKITSGRFQMQPERFDLADMVRDVVGRFQGEAHQSGCHLDVRAGEPVTGWWDRVRLEQVLSNLLSNAIKYGAGRRIAIDVGASDGVARLAVEDHGIGIEKQAIGRIFERFERAAPARHYGGLGLGLFIARQIVQAHGGRIRVESEPGAGSTFTVELPVEPRGQTVSR